MLRILGRPSSINVRKVLWTADEIGLSYQHEAQWGEAQAPTSSAAFVALNPNGLIPVIEDENGVLQQSNAICRYLARKADRRDLFPQSSDGAASVEQWMDWQATDLNDAWRDAFLGLVRRRPDYVDEKRITASAARWNDKMLVLDRALKDRPFVAGGQFTLADIVIGLSAHRWRSTPINHVAAPSVAAWIGRLEQRPGFSRYASARTP